MTHLSHQVVRADKKSSCGMIDISSHLYAMIEVRWREIDVCSGWPRIVACCLAP